MWFPSNLSKGGATAEGKEKKPKEKKKGEKKKEACCRPALEALGPPKKEKEGRMGGKGMGKWCTQ